MSEGALFGLEVQDLPEGYTPLEGIALVKCLTDEGQVSLVTRWTEGITPWEGAGMLGSAHDDARRILSQCGESENGDDD